MGFRCPKCGYEQTGKGADPLRLPGEANTNTTTCPYCGHQFERERSNPKGTGAHYAHKITEIGKARSLCLAILNESKAYGFESGLGLTETWKRIQRLCVDTGGKVPTKGGTSGRLSELQGMGLVTSGRNEVELIDPETQTFRLSRPQRWFLTETGRT
jgi:DNA-directed RNA polymerase subunit RPC12/RpoP